MRWFLFLLPGLAQAANLEGADLSLWWGLPFAGLLLSIALLPLFFGHFWHAHHGKVAAFWIAAFLAPFAVTLGWPVALQSVAHALLTEYLPFILMLLALYTISGGIWVGGHLQGTPARNTALLALGAGLASLMGTTGAAMLLIRPLLRANETRRHVVHIVVFFIFLVANIGGGLTPLGDPPLFLGFLQGIDFFWTLRHLWPAVLFLVLALLLVFYCLDRYFYAREEVPAAAAHDPVRLGGCWNFLLLAGVVGAVLMSGLWRSGISVALFGVAVPLEGVVRDGLLLALTLISLWITPPAVRAANEFDWFPMQEVAKLFAGIFITITPLLAILKAGPTGALAGLVQLVSGPDGAPINAMYFWMTGVLSSFLDNAPTYLVFFNLASGDPADMSGPLAQTLMAISMGAVFMGAMTYIGNAPNFMVRAIAERRGVKMPSFFGFILWSVALLLPLLLVLAWVAFPAP